MKQFIRTGIRFFSVGAAAFLALLALYFSLDPFKVLRNYDDYYSGNFVTTNRALICMRLFQKNRERFTYNSFIFGSSRSQAFKVTEWEKHLDSGATGFHFDASGEGIYGIYTKMKFIRENNRHIKNALILLDYEAMRGTKNKEDFIFISPPELSGESKYAFHSQFLKAYFDPVFLLGYLDYKAFHTYRDYMAFIFTRAKYDFISDNSTGDLYYGNDRMIQEDKYNYYTNLVKRGLLYDRNKHIKTIEAPVSSEEATLLNKIHQLLMEENSNYYIVISPAYDQEKLSAERLRLLKNIFGANQVFDFSGVNDMTASIYNYYEYMHFRPHVANEIMDSIYGQKRKSINSSLMRYAK